MYNNGDVAPGQLLFEEDATDYSQITVYALEHTHTENDVNAPAFLGQNPSSPASNAIDLAARTSTTPVPQAEDGKGTDNGANKILGVSVVILGCSLLASF